MKGVIFLLSLPRSGSTLVQRILMSHSQVASCGEPWLALPLARLFKPGDSFSPWGAASLVRSADNLFRELPGGKEAYLQEAGSFITRIYVRMAAGNEQWFLDKTPRYYHIIPELIEMFPDAKFVFLLREPVAVYSSILNYIDGRMHLLPTWEQDIVQGIPCIDEGISRLKGRATILRYEALVSHPEATIRQLLSQLGLEIELDIIKRFSEVDVKRGDQTGTSKYAQVSTDSINDWQKTVNSSTKSRIGRRWLSKVPEEAFAIFETSRSEQLEKLRSLKAGISLKDEIAWRVGRTYFGRQLNVLRWGHQRRRSEQPDTIY